MAMIDTYGDNVIKEWLQNHKNDEDWTPIDGIYVIDEPLVLLKNENAEYKYSVQFRETIRYYEHRDAAYVYMARILGENMRPPFENKSEPYVLLTKQQIKYAEVVWIEDRNWVLLQGVLDKVSGIGNYDFITWPPEKKRNYYNKMYHGFPANEYLKTWRCWSGKPSEALMKKWPWRDKRGKGRQEI